MQTQHNQLRLDDVDLLPNSIDPLLQFLDAISLVSAWSLDFCEQLAVQARPPLLDTTNQLLKVVVEGDQGLRAKRQS